MASGQKPHLSDAMLRKNSFESHQVMSASSHIFVQFAGVYTHDLYFHCSEIFCCVCVIRPEIFRIIPLRMNAIEDAFESIYLANPVHYLA